MINIINIINKKGYTYPSYGGYATTYSRGGRTLSSSQRTFLIAIGLLVILLGIGNIFGFPLSLVMDVSFSGGGFLKLFWAVMGRILVPIGMIITGGWLISNGARS